VSSKPVLESKDIKLEYQIMLPKPELSDFVERFYMIRNNAITNKEIVLIPDGNIDIFFTTESADFAGTLIGLETQPTTAFFPPKCSFIGVSLKLLSIEYILHRSIADILNSSINLPTKFWDISPNDLTNFDSFCTKISKKIHENIQPEIDERKQKLLKLVYETKGSLLVKEYAQKVFWPERQINRYFNQTFGLSLKSFCTILRFKASFQHLKNGILYPEQDFSDQAHFIKEVKKLTKVTPKELAKNKNDRFLQFSTMP